MCCSRLPVRPSVRLRALSAFSLAFSPAANSLTHSIAFSAACLPAQAGGCSFACLPSASGSLCLSASLPLWPGSRRCFTTSAAALLAVLTSTQPRRASSLERNSPRASARTRTHRRTGAQYSSGAASARPARVRLGPSEFPHRPELN